MSDVLVYTFGYNMMTICWLQECGILPNGCDLVLLGESPEFVERLRESGRFGNIFEVIKKNPQGRFFLMREKAINQILENPGRPYRRKFRYWEALNPGRFFTGERTSYCEYSLPQPYCFSMVPALYCVLATNRDAALTVWEHATFHFQISTARLFSALHYEGTKSLFFGLFGLGQPSTRVKTFYVSHPEILDQQVRAIVDLQRTPIISWDNDSFRREMNHLFRYTEEKRESFDGRNVIVLPLTKMNDIQTLISSKEFLKQVTDMVGAGNILIKPHPGARQEELELFGGYKVFLEKSFPVELSFYNLPDLDDRLIIAYYTTMAVLTPKLQFDAEPYILLLDDLFPFTNSYGDLTKILSIKEKVRSLYRHPEKMLFAKTWEDALEFVKNYRLEKADLFKSSSA